MKETSHFKEPTNRSHPTERDFSVLEKDLSSARVRGEMCRKTDLSSFLRSLLFPQISPFERSVDRSLLRDVSKDRSLLLSPQISPFERSVLQCVAVCCSVLQCVALRDVSKDRSLLFPQGKRERSEKERSFFRLSFKSVSVCV